LQAYSFPLPLGLRDAEERKNSNYRLARQNINDSPLYTRDGADHALKPSDSSSSFQQQSKTAGPVNKAALKNPFSDMETYSARFNWRPRQLPNFSIQPHSKRIFPIELHDIFLDEGDEGQSARRKRSKRLNVSGLGTLRNAGDKLKGDGNEDLQARLARLDAEAEAAAAEDGGVGAEDEEDEEVQAEDEDYAFDEDEEGDYNAEQYFDDGESDVDDGGDDGDDGIY
jgi:DNA-directed RNA polymerase III subunit RPC7